MAAEAKPGKTLEQIKKERARAEDQIDAALAARVLEDIQQHPEKVVVGAELDAALAALREME